MFAHFKGKISDRNLGNSSFVIEVNDVGYLIESNAKTLAKLKPGGAQIVYVHTSSNELGMRLCGFLTRAEKELFEILISVSGVGPKAALKILDSFEVDEFVTAVIREDNSLISKAPGVGKKTAARIILELQNKIKKNYNVDTTYKGSNKVEEEVYSILSGLGFDDKEIAAKVSAAYQAEPQGDVESLVKYCLTS